MALDRISLVACSAVLAFGCAHASHAQRDGLIAELGPVPSGSAQVCVVRPASMAAQVSMAVRDNGHLVGATRGTTFFCYLARAGEHQIASSGDDTGPLLLRAESRARYWLHQDVVDLAGDVHAHLDWVDEITGLEMLEACETRVRVAVPGHDDEGGAQPIAPAKL
jgi:hypothetical protein